jgi:hypothetical protein
MKQVETETIMDTNDELETRTLLTELNVKLKGIANLNWLFAEILTTEEFKLANQQIEKHKASCRAKGEKPQLPHIVDVFAAVRLVERDIATLDLALERDLIVEKRYRRLRCKLGYEAVDSKLDLQTAARQYLLVVDEFRRLTIWKQQELDVKFDEALWLYFWKLVCAARRGGAICAGDFSCETQPTQLANWKYRLTKLPGFSLEIINQINVQAGRHRLEVPAKQVFARPIHGFGTPVSIK